MDDEKAESLANVLGNKTCKKILEFLSEKEASEQDIADALKIPINTVEYNLKKLLESGFVEKSKNFFWSKKGRKILTYKISNKSIVISPKPKESSKVRSILPVAIISAIAALLIKLYFNAQQTLMRGAEFGAEAGVESGGDLGVVSEAPQAAVDMAPEITDKAAGSVAGLIQLPDIAVWFLIGALFCLIIFAILNWRKL